MWTHCSFLVMCAQLFDEREHRCAIGFIACLHGWLLRRNLETSWILKNVYTAVWRAGTHARVCYNNMFIQLFDEQVCRVHSCLVIRNTDGCFMSTGIWRCHGSEAYAQMCLMSRTVDTCFLRHVHTTVW